MALYYVASIAPVAYPAFFDLSGGRLPSTFEEWETAHTRSRCDLVMSGHHVVGIAIEPIDFRGYCRSMRCRADAVALAAYATRIGNERFGTRADYEALRARMVVTKDARADGRAPIDRPVAPPPWHWWQFWRPSYVAEPAADARAAYTPGTRGTAAVEGTPAGPARIEDVATENVVLGPPQRQHWWEIWRRPRPALVVGRRRSIHDRAA